MIIHKLFKKRKDRIIFIFGVPRGGTTWLWSLLESHKDVVPFIDGVEKDDNGSYKTSESGVYVRTPEKAKSKIQEFSKRNPHKIVLEKTPSHTLLYKKILKDFPHSTNVIIFRHPIAIVNSIINSEMEAFKEFDLRSAIKVIKDYYQKLEELSVVENSIKITYEDLLINTKKVLAELFHQLELDVFDLNEIIETNNKKSKVKVKGVLRKGTIDSFKEDLSTEERVFISNELKKEIDLYYSFKSGK